MCSIVSLDGLTTSVLKASYCLAYTNVDIMHATINDNLPEPALCEEECLTHHGLECDIELAAELPAPLECARLLCVVYGQQCGAGCA